MLGLREARGERQCFLLCSLVSEAIPEFCESPRSSDPEPSQIKVSKKLCMMEVVGKCSGENEDLKACPRDLLVDERNVNRAFCLSCHKSYRSKKSGC